MASPHNLPGPRPGLFWGHLLQFGNDPLGFLASCATNYGEMVPLRFLHRKVYLLNNPEDIETVLSRESRHFRKTLGYRTPFMRRLFGDGLLTSEGDFWQRQRKLAQPAFHKERIRGYAKIIVNFASQTLQTWKPGEVKAVHAEMLKLTTQVVVKSLFDAEVPPEIDQMSESSAVVMNRFATQWTGWRLLVNLLPTRSTRRFNAVMDQLDHYILQMIQERRRSGKDHGDLLSMLLQVRDEAGQGMSDRQLRDELTTLMVAGLDTTALAISWTCYLLAKNPQSDEKINDELNAVLGGRPPDFSDIPRLRYLELVVKESMRLYPPAWVVGREAIDACEVGGYSLEHGTSFVMSQWVMHRAPKYFPNPEQFQPERWAAPETQALPKFAYFPFGGGPRTCIGNTFAMMEAILVLATILQRFRFTCAGTYEVEPWASITLQPKHGINLKILPRSNSANESTQSPSLALAKE